LPGAPFRLAFSPAAERFYYEKTPYDMWGKRLGQYDPSRVPGYFLYSSRHDFLAVSQGMTSCVIAGIVGYGRVRGEQILISCSPVRPVLAGNRIMIKGSSRLSCWRCC
jgi:hypothetical protein